MAAWTPAASRAAATGHARGCWGRTNSWRRALVTWRKFEAPGPAPAANDRRRRHLLAHPRRMGDHAPVQRALAGAQERKRLSQLRQSLDAGRARHEADLLPPV